MLIHCHSLEWLIRAKHWIWASTSGCVRNALEVGAVDCRQHNGQKCNANKYWIGFQYDKMFDYTINKLAFQDMLPKAGASGLKCLAMSEINEANNLCGFLMQLTPARVDGKRAFKLVESISVIY